MNPRRTLSFILPEPPPEFFVPVPPTTPGQFPEEPALVNAHRVACLPSSTTPQSAWIVRSVAPGPVEVNYRAVLTGTCCAPGLFSPPATPRLRPSAALRGHARALLADCADTEDARIARLLADVAACFVYAHPPRRPEHDPEGAPAPACGLTPGSCVDIHCHAVALLAAAGIPAAYLAGLFVREGRPPEKPLQPGHCWIAVRRANSRVECYDIAHHLEHAIAGPVRAALNPHPGERLALQAGCDHVFIHEGCEFRAERLLGPAESDAGGVLKRLPASVRWSG